MTPHWAEPPPIGGPQDPRAKYVEILRPLIDHPMRWALIRGGTPSAVNQTRAALVSRQYNVPPGRWEFTVRTFRRGVHVGDMNVAQLYARYLGAGDNGYMTSRDAVYDDEGRRVCEDCAAPLPVPKQHGGKWPQKCDLCWLKIDPKWLRKRTRRRKQRRDARANGTWIDPRHKDGWRLTGEDADRYMVETMGVPPDDLKESAS